MWSPRGRWPNMREGNARDDGEERSREAYIEAGWKALAVSDSKIRKLIELHNIVRTKFWD